MTTLFDTSARDAVAHDLDETLFVEAQSGYRELGDDAYLARATRHLATCRLLGGQPRAAADLLRTCQAPRTDGGGDWDLAESLEEVSLINAATGDARRAATLAAAAAAVRERTGTRPHPFDRALAEPYLARARADRDAWNSGWQEGAGLPVDDVIELAQRWSSWSARQAR